METVSSYKSLFKKKFCKYYGNYRLLAKLVYRVLLEIKLKKEETSITKIKHLIQNNFSGKLIKRKNPILLLDAFKEVTRNDVYRDSCFIFVGDGEELPTLRKRITDLKLEKTVKLVGFINQGEIRKYYSIADLLVLPSS